MLTWFEGKSYYNMSYFVLLFGFGLFEKKKKKQDRLHIIWRRTICAIEEDGICAVSFNYL